MNNAKVSIYSAQAIASTANVSLSRGGLILIALLSGGDYHPVRLYLLSFYSSDKYFRPVSHIVEFPLLMDLRRPDWVTHFYRLHSL
jgi:hypothetical protein